MKKDDSQGKNEKEELYISPIEEKNDSERVIEIPYTKLVTFRDHPFRVVYDENMEEPIESVKENGILTPLIVRRIGKDRYEIISGHRRAYAAKCACLYDVPVIVRELSDDEAAIAMVDSNMQRQRILISEKAYAYKIKLEALKHQGKTGNITCAQDGHRLRSVEVVAKDAGESKIQIQRFIRLTNLIPVILNLVDEKKIRFLSAVELSYLSMGEQITLIDIMTAEKAVPSLQQAKELHRMSTAKEYDEEAVRRLLCRKNAPVKKYTVSEEFLREYLPEKYADWEIEQILIDALRLWCAAHKDDTGTLPA